MNQQGKVGEKDKNFSEDRLFMLVTNHHLKERVQVIQK